VSLADDSSIAQSDDFHDARESDIDENADVPVDRTPRQSHNALVSTSPTPVGEIAVVTPDETPSMPPSADPEETPQISPSDKIPVVPPSPVPDRAPLMPQSILAETLKVMSPFAVGCTVLS